MHKNIKKPVFPKVTNVIFSNFRLKTIHLKWSDQKYLIFVKFVKMVTVCPIRQTFPLKISKLF